MRPGPRKGKGGRPPYKLYDKPDRWILVGALLFGERPDEQQSFALLQLIDNFLTPHDCIELDRGTKLKDGVDYEMRSITNATPVQPSKRDHDGRQRLCAPGGKVLRVSRLKDLQLQMKEFLLTPLDVDEQEWLREASRDFARMALAAFVLSRWEAPDSLRKRFAELLRTRK